MSKMTYLVYYTAMFIVWQSIQIEMISFTAMSFISSLNNKNKMVLFEYNDKIVKSTQKDLTLTYHV